jgi:predicted GH43/DUF377 family glycosyl hydrolase
MHLFPWPVSPKFGWADPVKITAYWKVLFFRASQKKLRLLVSVLDKAGNESINNRSEYWM